MCQKICLYVTSGLESQVHHLQAPKSCSWHLIFLALSVPTVRISEALLSFYLYFLKQTPAPIHFSKQRCFLALGPSFLQEQAFLQASRKRLPWNPSPSCRPDRVPASLCLGGVPTAAACTHYRNILLPSPSGGPTQGPSQIWSSAVGNDIRTGSRMAARHDT